MSGNRWFVSCTSKDRHLRGVIVGFPKRMQVLQGQDHECCVRHCISCAFGPQDIGWMDGWEEGRKVGGVDGCVDVSEQMHE